MSALDADLGPLPLAHGGALFVRRLLRRSGPEGTVRVFGADPMLPLELRAMCRGEGHRWLGDGSAGERAPSGAPLVAVLAVGPYEDARWRGAARAGVPSAPEAEAPAQWGFAARGAQVEAGGPAIEFTLHERSGVWAPDAGRTYLQAAAAQWDPVTAITWNAPVTHDAEVEAAVVQVMTYLVENEHAALAVVARFLGRVHPHFREVVQVLAVQAADEARHIEVFTRRAQLQGSLPGLSTAGGQSSLKTLLDEPDFAVASFLLSVLGEGSFLSLLWFLHAHAPDPVTREVARLTAQDEARHVAFSLSHLGFHLEHEPALRDRLRAAIERRHSALQHTAGLNAEVFDALHLLAAGGWDPAALARGHEAVQGLLRAMDEGRQSRLRRLGFSAAEAEALSALHTRNFM